MIVVVFRSRVRAEHAEEYAGLVAEMAAIAESMPGFVSEKTFTAEDGERVSVQEWESEERLRAWRAHPGHLRAQQRGRDEFYSAYDLFVAESPRASRFQRKTD